MDPSDIMNVRHHNKKRRLSVSIVEPEEQQSRTTATLKKWGGDYHDSIRCEAASINNQNNMDDDTTFYNINLNAPSMTQDCIGWDEGRHDIDLRKLVDPNFQTPRIAIPSNNGVGDDDRTILSISPKPSSGRSYRSSTSSSSSWSHGGSNSRSPIPRRGRRGQQQSLTRRRESLDVVATGKLIPNVDEAASLLPNGCENKENHPNRTARTAAAAAAPTTAGMSTSVVVTTERHNGKRPLNETTHSNHSVTMTINLNINPLLPKQPLPDHIKSSTSSSINGTTDFADLLQKIQQNNCTNTNCNTNKNSSGTNTIRVPTTSTLSKTPCLNTTAVHKTCNNTSRTEIVPSSSSTVPNEMNCTSTTTSLSNTNNDDEFDNVDFSMEDIAALDAVLVRHTSTTATTCTAKTIAADSTTDDQTTKKLQPLHDQNCGTISEPTLTGSHHFNHHNRNAKASPTQNDSTSNNPVENIVTNKDNSVVENDDPFGEIPDIDIDALVLCTRNANRDGTGSTIGSSFSTEKVKDQSTPIDDATDDPFGEIPDIDIDALVHAATTHVKSPSSRIVKNDDIAHERKEDAVKDDDFVLPTMTYEDSYDDEFPDVDIGSLDLDICSRLQSFAPPPTHVPISNPRHTDVDESKPTYLTCSRYRILDISEDLSTYTKTVSLAEWTKDMLIEEDQKSRLLHHPSDNKSIQQSNSHGTNNNKWKVFGVIYLRGEWYHTQVTVDDIIHIVSLTGRFRTDILPLIFHTCPPPGSDLEDDLLLVVHPDLLLTPTIVSETVGCSRRAVLKGRLGATGITSRSALFGTMRHALFEATMKSKDFSKDAVLDKVKSIIRINAESLLACNVSSREAEQEVIKFLPQIQRFAEEFTEIRLVKQSSNRKATLESHGATQSVNFVAKSVEAVEEPVISPELGLKGNVDMLVEALMTPAKQNQQESSIMGIELKTSHNQQAQQMHVAQLALYIIMLQTRYGGKENRRAEILAAANSGMLLYMNNEMFRAIHIAPAISEIKSLIGMRNVAAIETKRSFRPRGIRLSYDASEDKSTGGSSTVHALNEEPTKLPDMLPNSFSCKKCYTNRECMMYRSAARNALKIAEPDSSHGDLLHHFTSHLDDEENEYFTKWDRLIDIEADASSSLITRSWLQESVDIENEFSACISSLMFDPDESNQAAIFDESWYATIGFKRSPISSIQTPLSDVGFEPGCRVVIGTDATSVMPSISCVERNKIARPVMHIVRGAIHKASKTHIYVLAAREDQTRIEKYVKSSPESSLTFRMDKESYPTGITTLRQNLVNLFTADKKRDEVPGTQVEQSRLSWLRDVLIRLRKPTFDHSLVKTMFSPTTLTATEPISGCDLMDLCCEFATLNRDQQSAVEQIIASCDYTLVQGLPGSGKTSTIAFVARLLAARGKRVLITSYTHAAVDNVILKLVECGLGTKTNDARALVRVGRKAACHSGVHALLASEIALELETSLTMQQRKCNTPSPEYLRIAMSNARIVGVSALSLPRSPLLFREHFDVVIVDEAGQISQPAIIGALLSADSFILVGDHMQLPPLVVSEIAEIGDYGISMLKRLADKHPDCVSQLTYQYRMHDNICQLSNAIVYNGKLKSANDCVAKQKMTIKGFPHDLKSATTSDNFAWLSKVIDPSNAVIFLDTDKICFDTSNSTADSICSLESTKSRRSGGSIINESEAFIVQAIIEGFTRSGVDPSSIGIICPFRAQLRLLDENESFINWKRGGLEVSTIDRFQGRDKPVIIVSFVRSNTKGKVGHLLEDFRRLNVAVTRAKYKLIMVGSFSTLYKGSDVLKTVLDRVSNDNHLIQLPSNVTFT